MEGMGGMMEGMFPPGSNRFSLCFLGMNMEGMAGMMEGMIPPGSNPFSQGMFPPWIEAGLKPKKRGKGKKNPNLRFT